MPLKHYSSNSFLPSASLPTGTLNVGKHVKTSYRNLFSKIWENRKSIRIETSARNFLVTSVRNNCIDYLRKQELELAWKQWKIGKGDEPSGDIYSIVELRTMFG